MPDWDAEASIDAALVRALLSEQFQQLEASSARLLGEGWDNAVWVVEETWAFRFPRRQIAIPGVRRELAVLPELAPLLSISIPVPTFVGEPSERFSWPFFGARLLPGNEIADSELSDEARVAVGVELGRFLRELHAPELRARVDPEDTLPVDPPPGRMEHAAGRGTRGVFRRVRSGRRGRPEPRSCAGSGPVLDARHLRALRRTREP